MAAFDFIPEVWCKRQGIYLKKKMVGLGITNQNYTGEIKDMGDTVKLWYPGDITVGTYTKNTGFSTSLQIPTDTEDTLIINASAAYRFYVDKINQVQGALDPEGPYNEKAAYAMSDTIDQAIMALYASVSVSNIVYPSAAVTSSTILAQINSLSTAFDTSKVPQEGRYLVLSPRAWGLLKAALQARGTQLGDETLLNGKMTRVDGFDIYMSHNVVATTGAGTSGSTGAKVVHKCLAGVRDGITLAYSIPPSYAEVSKVTGIAGNASLMGRAIEGMAIYGLKVWNSGAMNGYINCWWDS